MTVQGTSERFNWWEQPEAAGPMDERDFENQSDAGYGKPGYSTIGPIPPVMPAWMRDRDRGVVLRPEPEPEPAPAPEPERAAERVLAAVPEAPVRAGNGPFLPGNPGRGKAPRKLSPARTRPETDPR